MFDLAAALATGQPFLGHIIKRQCGVLLIAAEGADEVRLRLDAVVRAKCGGAERIPFRWYEKTPRLLQKDATKTLIAMARQDDKSLRPSLGCRSGWSSSTRSRPAPATRRRAARTIRRPAKP